VKSVVWLAVFVKKLCHTGLPDFKSLYELEPVCSVKKIWSLSVPL